MHHFGHPVQADANDIEKKTAEVLRKAYNTDVIINPRITYPQNVSNADYTIFDEKYDMKEITGNGKDTLRDGVKKKKAQASNFVFEVSGSEMTIEEIERQIM